MKKILILLAISVVTFACGSNGEAVDLGFNLTVGETYKYSINMEMEITQNMLGQKMITTMNIDDYMSMKVLAKNGNNYDMEAWYDNMRMPMKMPMFEITMDSNSADGDDIFSTIMRSMVDKTFEITMSDKGKIVDVRGFDNLVMSIVDEFPDIDEDEKEQLCQQISGSFGESSIKSNFEMSMAIYPDHPVKKGDKWNISTTAHSNQMVMNMERTYTYKGLKDGKHLIAIVSDITITDTDENYKEEGVDVVYKMTGKLSSEFSADTETGWVVSGTADMDISGDMIIESPEFSYPLEMKMEMKSKIKYGNK